MRFRIGSHLLDAEVQSGEPRPAEGTGATGERVVISFTVAGPAAQEAILDLLAASGQTADSNEEGLTASTPEGDFAGHWTVVDASYTVDGEGDMMIYSHAWELAEASAT